ncbi:hypothetical protein [Flavobacterium sp.]|uniref:hypothetical protein n=1 Tax=Flavobacterium sp. TaxID=239 RepID=UPI003751218F
MENDYFTKEQFGSMTRVQKADLIEKCVLNIIKNNPITIDGIIYTELSAFTYWLVDNV